MRVVRHMSFCRRRHRRSWKVRINLWILPPRHVPASEPDRIRWADVVEREGHPFHSMDEQYVALRKSNHKDPFGFVTLGPVVSSIMHEMKSPDRARVIPRSAAS